MVVTALKRDTKIQDTPLAITAVTGATLRAQGITDSSMLAQVSPGLVVTEGGFSGTRQTLRNIYAAGEATVGLYYDDTPVTGSAGVNADAGGTTPALRLFDVDRVEVLRGPQGTLYGSSSEAGTIRLIFAKPKLDLYEATVMGEFSHVARSGADGDQTQAMVNIPVLKDLLAVRVVGFYQDTPGYIDNIKLGKGAVNRQEAEGGRFAVRFKPTDKLTIDGLAVVQSTNGGLSDYAWNLGKPYTQNYGALQTVKDDFQLYSVTGNWDLGLVKLTGIVSHSQRDLTYNYDITETWSFLSSYAAAIGHPSLSPYFSGIGAVGPSVANSPQKTSTDTAEFRFASNTPGPLQYTAGAFYSDRIGNIESNPLYASPVSGDPLPVNSANLIGQRIIADKLRQIAGFAEVTYNLTNKLAATAGVRYYNYTRGTSTAVTTPITLLLPLGSVSGKTDESGFLYKLDINYKFTPRVMGYVTASSGERPGGVNVVIGLPSSLQDYKSDAIWNYETGLKSELFDRKLTVNIDGYMMDWYNIQSAGSLSGTAFQFIHNAGDARIFGSEVETTYRPLRGLQFQASMAYDHATLTSAAPANALLIYASQKGDFIPYSPTATAHASAEYDWDLTSQLRASIRAEGAFTGSSWTQYEHTNAFEQRLPSYSTADIRGTISGPGDWSVSIFANNLFDNDAPVNKLTQILYGAPAAGTPGPYATRAISLTPRTIGVDVTKHF